MFVRRSGGADEAEEGAGLPGYRGIILVGETLGGPVNADGSSGTKVPLGRGGARVPMPSVCLGDASALGIWRDGKNDR